MLTQITSIMRYILFVLLFFVSFVARAQNKTIERAGYHSIVHHKYNTTYLMESIERSQQLRKKSTTSLIVGGGLLAAGTALYIKGLSIHPVYQIGNPFLNGIANDMKDERSAYLVGATGLYIVGAYFTIRGIRLSNRASLTLSSSHARINFNLYGR